MDKQKKEQGENTAAQRRKRYPLLPYLLGLLVTVILIILLSYFSRQNSEALMKMDAEHNDNIEVISDRLDSIEGRLKLLEEQMAGKQDKTEETAENTGTSADNKQ